MKKWVKIFIGVLLVLCILGFGFTYYYLYVYERELSGEKVTDGVYSYNLDFEDHFHNTKIYNKNIYYSIELEDKYEFYEINVYNNELKKIGEHSGKNNYCFLDDDYITCSGENKITYYDYKFKKIYEGGQKTLIPYKKDYIKIENNIAYYKNKEYKKISKDLTGLNDYRYEKFDNNVYIFFSNENDDCILNLEEDKCEDFKYTSLIKYADGFYYTYEDKINVLNLETKETKEYDNFLKDEWLTLSQLDKNQLYYFSADYLRIYNLDTNEVELFDYRIKEPVDNVYLVDGLVYLITNKKAYVVKLDEITTSKMTVEELDKEFENRLTERIEKIRNEYNFDIKIRKEANLNLKVWDQKTIGETNYDTIIDALDYIDEVLETFGPEFFKQFVHGEYTGVRLYLVSEIRSDFSMSGEAFRYYDKYAIIAEPYDIKRTLYHELMHTLEDAVFAKNKNMFSKWDKYNPKGFKYRESYHVEDPDYKYTAYSNKGDVYFVDNYSQTNGLEDRARIFENLCMGTTDVITKHPYLLKKAKYLEQEIVKYYPMLKDSVIFESLKEKE